VLPSDEHFFGLGERFCTVDHRGTHYEAWTEEGGIGQGEGVPPGPDNPSPNGTNMTHVPIPFWISTRGYGLYMETTYRTGYSLGADDPGLYRIYAAEPHLRYHVFVHADPKDTIADYTALTGRARLPAPWVFGPRLRVDRGSMINGVPEADALRAASVPTTMIDDATHFLPIGSEVGQEASITAYNAAAHANGFKPIAYYNAFVSTNDPAAATDYAYGKAHDLFVKTSDGAEYDCGVVSAGEQTCATIDLTNPEAVTWYGTLLERALDLGYDGWMLDFGEYLPEDALMHDGTTGWEGHNAFPLIYETAAFDYLTEARGSDFMFFARSGYAGTQAVAPVVWSGDPGAGFDEATGLPAHVRGGINAGISGIAFWGSDISGYTCINEPPVDKELYLRWAEFGALSTDMHDENACTGAAPGAPPKWDIWSDAETIQVYAEYASLHTRLFPYTYAAAQDATLTGLPIMRHPLLLHPTSSAATGVELEYYFGPALYVAPVVERGETSRSLWLPPGSWVDWWTNAAYAGDATITRDAPIDTLPLFLRSGGVVPMLDPSVQTLAPRTNAGVVSMDDVTGIYDVRAAIDPVTANGSIELVDGTLFTTALGAGAVTLPASITTAPDEAALATCNGCGLIEPLTGGATHVRISVAGTNDALVQAGALALHHHAVEPLRVRWDVVVLP
jgi:alpha-glucosidase (family GH31 glycosyl hydrolase)